MMHWDRIVGNIPACGRGAALALGVAAILTAAAAADPFIWDDDDDRIDDRIETVHLLGYEFSFPLQDTLKRQRFQVVRDAGNLVYGVYVRYENAPTPADRAALQALGMPLLHELEYVPAIRSVATFVQAAAAAELPGVERIEAVPVLGAVARDGAAAIGVRDATASAFPTWTDAAPDGGAGVVVAILDSGVNDAADGSYPGHESVAGRCLGGGVFVHGDSGLDTPKHGSVNPVDRGGPLTQAHGTHVAGIVLGSGGTSGFARGVAPAAHFVDVKVVDDLGVATAVAEALDWCIANRNRNWGHADPALRGIDVINLSLSSFDASDGNDVTATLARRAAELGIVVVASMGNEGAATVPSPASGDGVLAVGAWDVQRTGAPGDDQWPALNNVGPRASDGDLETLDELKPDLLAPGVAVLSADGDLATSGAEYRRATGTSMAAAFVSGAAALLLSHDDALAPADLAALLRATARRNLDAPAGSGGPDPRWRSTRGFGVVDVWAARLELEQPLRTQVRRLGLATTATTIDAELWTQRERGAQHLVFERAPDVGGAPGAFAPVDSVPAAGDPSIDDATNLTAYARSWPVPEAERGAAFWYRAAYTEGGARWTTPARRLVAPVGPPAATVEVVIVHNAYDEDVDAVIESRSTGAASSHAGTSAGVVIPLPGSAAAASSDWVNGASALGNVAHTFRVAVPHGAADAHLPPSPSSPWVLRVTEGGFLNRGGRVASYRVIWHGPEGDEVHDGGPSPAPTVEGATIALRAPLGVLAVPDADRPGVTFGPNPVAPGGAVTFQAAGASAPPPVTVFDLSGRRVGIAAFAPAGESRWVARWSARRADGAPAEPGVYYARSGPARGRLVVLPR